MEYIRVVEGVFIKRPNRFIAHVLIDNKEEIVHVKNTGRCLEILKPGVKVFLEPSTNPNRKTKYSLISVYKKDMLINIDSQVPNKVVYDGIVSNHIECLKDVTFLKREVTYNNSRFDIYYEKGKEKGFIEVKGVTLEEDGIAMFPDAPTTRGTKHINELIEGNKEGYINYIFFLIQMDEINRFKPNIERDKAFSEAVKKAKENGITILGYNSGVTRDSIIINKKIYIDI
ncbi:sugar fermentation stimulation protein A [Natranaerovirga pectinivora]|uniref:Sugar fermentation stimulation protein homolog n=1 Tax=Natranaerovirga pectinivora TaxID=682400 RepID=A0A4R3MKG6_9FIRM|nr:DNA/RNA nuclease SfsA [Natranaerovirga pectinivora]TCT12302.1 sugar fermentation stimulation protein A [Natranaerovirga pectinivora]